jgi:putative glutamine amidotransferase
MQNFPFKTACIFLSFLSIGCDAQTTIAEENTLAQESHVLLISKDNGSHIKDWMLLLNSKLTIKECYGLADDSLDFYLKIADAIVIGGGNDVNPALYNKPEYAEICGKLDTYRDTLELKMIHYAAAQQVPILGICRGQQILNVAHGGTLIPDIPSFITGDISHRSNKDSAHVIAPVNGSWISNTFQKDSFWVNSRHHQAIAQIAEGFEVLAYAPDSVIEAIGLKSQSSHPFTMGVQFHPENLRDSLSNAFGMRFLNSIE